MMVFVIGFEVIGQAVDARGEQGNLYFGRSCVARGMLVFGYDFCFVYCCYSPGVLLWDETIAKCFGWNALRSRKRGF